MKFVSIYLEGIVIEIHNNLFGVEQIKVNGNLVSSKFSIFGAKHDFIFDGHQYKIVITSGFTGVWYDLYKDGIPIIETTKNGCLIVLAIVLVSVIALDYLGKLIR